MRMCCVGGDKRVLRGTRIVFFCMCVRVHFQRLFSFSFFLFCFAFATTLRHRECVLHSMFSLFFSIWYLNLYFFKCLCLISMFRIRMAHLFASLVTCVFLTYKICIFFLSNKVCVYSILNKALNEFHRNKPGTLMKLPVCFKIVRFVTNAHFLS